MAVLSFFRSIDCVHSEKLTQHTCVHEHVVKVVKNVKKMKVKKMKHVNSKNPARANTAEALTSKLKLVNINKVKVKVSFIVNAAICTGHTED